VSHVRVVLRPLPFHVLLIVLSAGAVQGARADGTHGRSATRPRPAGAPEFVSGISADHVIAPASLYAALARIHARIPSFSRQTKLACSACHYQFPQLTPFGRLFKLNGYTLTGLQTIGQPTDTSGSETLKLAPIPPASAMVVTSFTRATKAQPQTQNNTADFPQQFSLFLSGQVTPNVGAFTQFTYASTDGSFGIDNIDVRYAKHMSVADRDMVFGLTVNNNPSVQDVWNTTPAWAYPFIGSAVAPTPMAATLIDGTLAQSVVGMGAYSLWNNLLYAEVSAYRSAPQGMHEPLDSTASNTTKGVAPYWRLAVQHQSARTYAMLGTFGLSSELFPTGITGPTNSYADVGVDAQLEQKIGDAVLIGRTAYIHERGRLNGSVNGATPTASVISNSLNTLKANFSWLPSLRGGMTLGYFLTSGTSDALLYSPSPVVGSGTGSPNSSGLTGEVVFNPWQNTRLGLQYVAYQKFNGASNGYDGAGRNASDNNTLYAYLWFAF
jgi:hypothetical protein